MKKTFWFFTLCLGFIFMGCTQKPAETKPIIIEKTTKVVVKKEEPKNSTTITLDKNEVKVEAKEVDIKVKSK